MNQTFQSIRIGVFFVLGLALIYSVYSVIGTKPIGGESGYQLTARFDNLRTLSPGVDVRMAGVRIGEVKDTALDQGRGLVTMSIGENFAIPADSVATITMASLLGQNYISISYGQSADLLVAGDEILSEEGPDFNEIMGEIQQLGEKLNSIADGFSGFGGEGMNEMFDNINDLLADNRERIDNVLVNMDEVTTKLNRGEGTLGKLINDDGLYSELMLTVDDFRSSSGDLKEALAGVKDLVDQVQQGEGTIGRLLVDGSIADEIEATVANLKEFSDKLNSGQGTLGLLVTDDSLYYELKGMLNKADQALDSMGDSGPITAAGAVGSVLF